jgi:hypothetical protein
LTNEPETYTGENKASSTSGTEKAGYPHAED